MTEPVLQGTNERRQFLSAVLTCAAITTATFAVVLGLQRLGIFQSMELSVYDFMIVRQEVTPDNRILIVGVTEDDIHHPQFGGWPMTDGDLAQLLERIAEFKPHAIGLDIFRDLPIPKSGEQLEQLNSVLLKYPNIITILQFQSPESPQINPPAVLGASLERVGFNDFPVDFDNVIRRALLFLDDGETTYFSFGWQLALAYLSTVGIFPEQPDADHPERIQLGQVTYLPLESNNGGYVNAEAGGYSFLLDFKGPRKFDTCSLTDVQSGKLDEEMVRDRIVLIGAMAESLKDYYPTILNYRQYGVVSQAMVVNQLIRGALQGDRPTRVWGERYETLWIFVWALAGGAVGLLAHSPMRLFSASIIQFLAMALTIRLLFQNGIWVISVAPMAAWLVAIFGATLVLHVTRGRQEQQLRHMFSTMVSPKVLQYMTDKPDRFCLTGERKDATIFFSDVAGFTAISERITAEDLAALLNRYLTPMSDIILDYGGYIDKYEGDAIMADFGVPIWPDPDPESHAWKCCWSALDQQVELARLNPSLEERFGTRISVRMGINTGEVSAGNMGSEQKFQYTVMGDVVNQAARFQPANRFFGSRIIIGETTYRLARKKIEIRLLATMILKGKKEPVKLYELIAKAGEMTEEQKRLVVRFEEARQQYIERRFDEAQALYQRCLDIDPDDGPSLAYLEKCRQFLSDPPPKEWAGEWVQG